MLRSFLSGSLRSSGPLGRKVSRGNGRSFALRPRGARAAAVEVMKLDSLEERVMLSAGGTTCTITDTSGADFTIDAAAEGFEKILVDAGASIGTLTVNGGSADLRVVIVAGAEADSVVVNGGSGRETVAIYGDVFTSLDVDAGGGNDRLAVFSSGIVGDVTFDGGAGNDSAVFVGDVLGFGHTIDGGADNDAIVFANGVTVEGQLDLLGGTGDDRIALRRGVQAEAVTVDLTGGTDGFGGTNAGGTNVFDMTDQVGVFSLAVTGGNGDDRIIMTDSQTGNDFGAVGGEGDDRFVFTGTNTIGGSMQLDGGEGDDRFAFDSSATTSVLSDQTIAPGLSNNRDTIRFGADVVGGTSRINVDGTLYATESAARDINGDYVFDDLFESNMQLSLTGGSDVAGSILITAFAESSVSINATSTGFFALALDGAGTNVANLQGLTMSADEGEIIFGGGNDELYLGGATFTDYVLVDMGNGDDFVDNVGLTVIDAEFYGGSGFDTITDSTIGEQFEFEA